MLRSSKSNASLRSGGGSTETGLHPNLGLHSAAASGNIGVVKFALDNGQPHNSILNGLFPLHAASSGGSEDAVRMLLAYGADVNVTRLKVIRGGIGGTGSEGSTPLHYAAANGHTTIVRILLENGARPTAQDRDGFTPISIATAQGHNACVALLRSWIGTYGPNGLAGPQSNTVDQDNTNLQPSPSSSMRTQRSFESLSSAAAGVKATLRNHKKQALAKVSSNPNLRSLASNASPPSPPPPLPITSRAAGHQDTPQSTPPQTLSSVPVSIARESKRRPSLPSIFERAAQSSSAFRNALSSHSSQTNQPDSIEELTPEDAGAKPPISPSRSTHRLTNKKSLTGLLGKASSTNSNVEEMTKPLQILTSSPLSLPRTSAVRSRSGSIDVFAQSPVNYFARPDMSILQSSPTSSMDNADNSTKQSSPAAHAFRPRKSSNLSSTIHTKHSVDDFDSDHGRKRSQSATSVPKRSSPVSERETLGKLSVSQRPLQRQQIDNHSDETKEFISTSCSNLLLKERNNTPTRYRSSNRSPLFTSKMLPEESDLRNGGFLSTDPASPSLGFRQLRSQTSTSSLVSSTSSNNTNTRQTRLSSNSNTGMPVEEELKTYLEPGSMTRSNRSTSYSESTASKTSTSSARSFATGLTAQEQAQAILRSADENSFNEVPAISLTQMLASYGEALAQERRGVSHQHQPQLAHLYKQPSVASLASNNNLGHQLRGFSENLLGSGSDSTSLNRLHPRSVTPISTPPDSPQTTRSRADSSATSFSRSPSSNRQKVTSKELNKVTNDFNGMTLSHHISHSTGLASAGFNGRNLDTQWEVESRQVKNSPPLEMPVHKHSPSLLSDLTLLAGPLLPSDNSPETTPRSKRRQNSHRPTTSDSHSSLDQLHSRQSDSYSPTTNTNLPLTPKLHKMSSINDFASSSQILRSASSSKLCLSPDKSSQIQNLPSSSAARWKDDTLRSSDQTGKRKGTVKAFLHGIKNNVVR